MPRDFLLALDQGTTSSRAILFESSGKVHSVAQRELTQFYPQPGWVEQDPMEIWSSQSSVMTEVLARAGIRARDVAAIGITNQRETAIVWDRHSGHPLAPAIVWQDRRTAGFTDQLRAEGFEPEARDRTGLLLDPYFSASKFRWFLDHVDGLRDAAESGRIAFGTVDSWLLWKLTDGACFQTDVTNASRTLLMKLDSGNWDPVMLERFGIPIDSLPQIQPSSWVFGECTIPAVSGIPIAGIAGDQHAALFGQACFEPGMAKNTYGTGSFLLMNTATDPVKSQSRLLSTVGWQVGDRRNYALEGSIFMSGAIIQWLRDGLGFFRAAPMVEALAESVPDSGGVFLVPAFAGLGAPHWDPHAGGLMIGMTRGTTDAHVARAALDAIAHQVCDVIEAMERDLPFKAPELRVDGGASRNNLLMQIQADLLGRPVVRPKITESTALGAACLAGLATGQIANLDILADQWKIDRIFEPNAPRQHIADQRALWKRAVEKSFGWRQG